MTKHAPGSWYLAPADDLSDDYSAGWDENSFATKAEAEAAIKGLEEASAQPAAWHSPTMWVAVQRRPDVAAYLAEIIAVGKRYGMSIMSLSHDDGNAAIIVDAPSEDNDKWLLRARPSDELLRQLKAKPWVKP